MKITDIAAKPKLIEVKLDSEEIKKEFGEEGVTFWTWDRQPLDMFMKLASSNQKNYGEMVEILKDLILDENGKPVINGETMVPTKVLVAAMTKITDMLGN